MKKHRRLRAPVRQARSAGFSLVEVLVASALTVVVMAIVFGFFVNTSKSYKSEQAGVDMQQAARVAVDELGRMLQQAGFGVLRPDPYNAGEWQRSIVYAGANSIAFNADLDPDVGPLDSSQSIEFASGEIYLGQGASNRLVGAETYVFGLDADGDDLVTLKDRQDAEPGGFNPAAGTENPLDFALFRRMYGYTGVGYATVTSPIIPYLFSGAVAGVTFEDGVTPEPLFTYVLTEDLDGNGTLDPGECVNDVVDTCPPGASRPPLQYIWGDSDFDGSLSDAERAALRTVPVGSTAWDKNTLHDAGVYHKSRLEEQTDPPSQWGYVLKVTDASKFAVGSMVVIGTGGASEQAVIEEIDTTTTPHQVMLTANPDRVHLVGASIQIVPDTLLRAIRAVQINFTSISPTKDRGADGAPAGQTGRKTAHGMDYRTMTLQRTIELVNSQTAALRASAAGSGTSPTGEREKEICPYTIVSDCAGSPLTGATAFVNGGALLDFIVTNSQGNHVSGAVVKFSRSGSAGGVFSDEVVTTDSGGRASVTYSPTGASLGTDTITATTTCGGTDHSTSTDLNIYDVQVSVGQYCLSTVSGRTSTPSTAFAVHVEDGSGPLAAMPMKLFLALDEDYVSPVGNFSNIQADLYEGGSLVASTDSIGESPVHITATDGNGDLAGAVGLSADNSDGGTRVRLTAATANIACKVFGGSAVAELLFYKLELDSVTPISGCTEGAPCTIPAGGVPPTAFARLLMAGQPVPNIDLDFSTTDTHSDPDIPVAISELTPGQTVTTDANGEAQVEVGNNGSSSITSGNPLYTVLDVASTGEPAYCGGSAFLASDPKVGFVFEGNTESSSCDQEIQQSWISMAIDKKKGTGKMCLSVKNIGELGSCPQNITGVRFKLYAANGIDPDNSVTVDKVKGGFVGMTTDCGAKGDVNLFQAKCNSNQDLGMDQRWDFVDMGKDCKLSPNEVGPGEHYTFKEIRWPTPPPAGRKLDLTLFYECTGSCASGGTQKTFSLIVP